MTDSYVQYVRLMNRLHWLTAEGRGDSEEADELRDDMDGPWYLMTDAEREIVRKMSAEFVRDSGGE
jgi:hypothetical protein